MKIQMQKLKKRSTQLLMERIMIDLILIKNNKNKKKKQKKNKKK